MHVIVLGAGVIGTTTAYYLAREGFKVTVIERLSQVAHEASYANAGQISPGYSTPWAAPGVPLKALKWLMEEHAPLAIKPTLDMSQYRFMWQMLMHCNAKDYAINKERLVRISEYSRDVMDKLRQEIDIHFDERQLGTLQLFRTQKQVDAAAKDIEVLREMGVAYELLDTQGVARVEPALAKVSHKIAGGLRLPGDQTGDCLKFTTKLAEKAKELGVEFRFEQKLERFELERGAIKGVIINGKKETADHYVVCLGSFTPQFIKPLGLNAPIYPMKGYSITVPITNPEMAPVSTVLDETYKVAVTRFDDRIRIGGMAELRGFDYSLNPKREATLRMICQDLYPEGGDLSGDVSFWTGLRPKTPDCTPIIGKTKYPNLFINAGHGTLGWTMACGSAQLSAHLLANKTPEISIQGLDISRY
ncbi:MULTISPECIES: D-amino acid dehydrogenase [Oligella]|uniref:Glycine oxidase n=1 Tax=Oligella urethralis TaxID=90245 RepID=A0A2N6QIM3_9BURK|nr:MULTISPECIES: D-amino acid dehydrogenase [Oligella]AVL70129.1 D-amino acid dehydrogenase small subunit [Oligella urethralis]MDK6202361.1 D-amino acid dehydrogenase [Oligella urethralis]OFS84070.1 D-amino acid dehydrogenase small subunit [Oligella sp. HMSC05A10]OFV45965.1 D-amino acid dehydrogenase small subunit [Oligella sp. HMSC09E12]PMC19422.1 D-amino acid dehydrogenase small subunit [Oligella urethralis]